MTRGMTAIREALRGWGDAQTVDVCIGEDTVVVTVGEFRRAMDAQAERAPLRAYIDDCERDVARVEADALRLALADADIIMEERERQLTAALEAVADERARCAAVCREMAARYRYGACGCEECEGRSDGARECVEAIERGVVAP